MSDETTNYMQVEREDEAEGAKAAVEKADGEKSVAEEVSEAEAEALAGGESPEAKLEAAANESGLEMETKAESESDDTVEPELETEADSAAPDSSATEEGEPDPESGAATTPLFANHEEGQADATVQLPGSAPAASPDASPSPAEGPDGTAVRPAANVEETAVVEARQPRGRVRQALDQAHAFLCSHKKSAAVAGALVIVLVALLVIAGIRAGNIPAQDVVAADARTRVSAPDYDGGKWGDGASLQVTDVEVRSIEKTPSAIDPSAAIFGASGYAKAEVEVTFENDSIRATKTATLGFAKVAGAWTAIGGEADANAAFEAKKGVNAQAVRSNATALLERAEQYLHEEAGAGAGDGVGEKSLAGIYSSGQIAVGDSNFDEDAQTDSLTVDCKKDGTFDSYSTQLTVSFAFRPVNGLWEIVGIDVPVDAKTRSFVPLLGTWTGTFQTQETDGGKCLAAAAHPLTITVEQQEGSRDALGTGAQLIGTVSGLAHFHANPESDAQGTQGDAELADVALAATYVPDGADGSDLAFRAELPDQAGGNVQVTLEFGRATDPDAVVAVVESDYARESTFLFIPYSEKATYRDTYVLRRQ